MDNRPPRKILKSPVAKRRSRLVPKDQKLSLERVLGLTASNNAAVACDPNTGTIAYPAGCVVVLYNSKKNKQSHIFNVSKKTLTSVAFSGDGKHLITGESGHQPAVRVWDVADKVQVAEFLGHKFGISCVAFSPNLKYIVSIGTQHDMQVNVWNWKTGSKVASNKVSSKVSSVAFSADGSYFVTVGMRHVKFWYLESSKSKINETVPLNGRNGILGDHRNNFFCDVAMGTGKQEKSTFCITRAGLLCQFNEKRQMDKWVELRTTMANAISAADNYIIVGCANGIVRVFSASSLHYVATLPHPHHLGVDVAAAHTPSQLSPNKDADIRYPDTVAVRFDEEHRKVTCLYNDHSMYVWDIHDLKKIGKAWSFLYHSSCVYGVEIYPMVEGGTQPILPPHSFFTCSSDDTIRIWNLDPHMAETPTYKNNIYSHELLKVMYMDPSLTSLCDVDYNPSGATDKTDTNYDDKNGIRSIEISPDGQHLASGDRQGNVRIHELQNLTEIRQIEAHESEVLCLEYSNWKNGPKILASSSRDRLLHVYDREQQYGLLQTLSDHSSAISAVKFTDTDGQLKMLSCGADKSILFRNLQQEPDFQFQLGHHLVEKMTLYDMDVEPSHKFAAIACQDRSVRIYNVKTGKKKKEYKGSLTDDGILLRMKLDPSGSYAITSCSDKNLCILDFYTGELLASMNGHSEIATDVRFMNDLRHVISTSGDGCIFVWKLPKEMTSQMQTRLREMGKATQQMMNGSLRMDPMVGHLQDQVDSVPIPQEREFFSPQRVLKEIYPDDYNSAGNAGVPEKETLDYRFSISQMPNWVKKQVDADYTSKPSSEDQGASQLPKNRWAQRAEGQGLTMKQQDGKSVDLEFATDRRRFTYEADTLGSQLPDVRRETMVLNRPSTTPKNMPVIQSSTNEDDDEEDFLPASSTTFVKQDTEKDPVSWDDLYNFDTEEAEGAENTEIIYYPPSESDGSDTLASSYQVFDAGFSTDRLSRLHRHSTSMSNTDGDSETTDPVSLEDMEEEEDSIQSTPSTPLDEVGPKAKFRERFLKDTFENLSFTPELPTDKFVKGLDNMEAEMAATQSSSVINSRLSLSARFLSKAQAANIKNMGVYGSIQRQDNWFDSVQRRKDDMARNLDESRKMLKAMGWKQDSPEADGEEPFRDPSTSPSRTTPDLSPTQKEMTIEEEEERTPTNFSYEIKHQPEPPANYNKASSVESSSRTRKDLTPVGRKTQVATVRPRSLLLDKDESKTTPTDKKSKTQARTGLYTKKTTPSISTSSRVSDSRTKTSRLSTPNLGEIEHTESENRRASFGSNLNKSKSTSLHSLTFETDENTPTPTRSKPRSKWSTSKLASFASVPNLFAEDSEKDKLKLPDSVYNMSSESSPANINNSVNENKVSKRSPNVVKTKSKDSTAASKKSSAGTSEGSRRSASASRLSTGSVSRSNSVEDKKDKGFVRKVGASVSSMKKTDSTTKSKDRDLMPPPATTNFVKPKQDTRFSKRANQPRRKTTSDLTFEQAKDILKGKSGILSPTKQKETARSSSSSPPGERKSVSDDIGVITDPNILTVASEIEMTAAELRRKSAHGSSMEASPYDPPERDIPAERDIPVPKPSSNSSSSASSVHTYHHKHISGDSDSVKSNSSGEDKEVEKDALLPTQEGEECSSPSVKDRIARLNQRVQGENRDSSSPYRLRSQSPSVDSPRVRSTVKVNFSQSSATQPLSSSTTLESSQGSPMSCSTSSYDISQTSASTTMTMSRMSPGLVSSLDSDGLGHHMSTSYHSNTSPQSTTDTGLGSDTDLELLSTSLTSQSSVFTKVDQKDPVMALQETMDQLQSLSTTAVHLYKQLQNRSDTASVQACERFSVLGRTVSRTLDLQGGGQETVTLPVEKYNKLIDIMEKLESVSTVMNNIKADIKQFHNL